MLESYVHHRTNITGQKLTGVVRVVYPKVDTKMKRGEEKIQKAKIPPLLSAMMHRTAGFHPFPDSSLLVFPPNDYLIPPGVEGERTKQKPPERREGIKSEIGERCTQTTAQPTEMAKSAAPSMTKRTLDAVVLAGQPLDRNSGGKRAVLVSGPAIKALCWDPRYTHAI